MDDFGYIEEAAGYYIPPLSALAEDPDPARYGYFFRIWSLFGSNSLSGLNNRVRIQNSLKINAIESSTLFTQITKKKYDFLNAIFFFFFFDK